MVEEELRAFYAAQIRAIRESKGLTQYRLSELSGISRANIMRIEQGKYDIRISTLHKILDTLECKIVITS